MLRLPHRFRARPLGAAIVLLAALSTAAECPSERPLGILETIDRMQQTGERCAASTRDFAEVMRQARALMFEGQPHDHLVAVAKQAHQDREQVCADHRRWEDEVDARLPAVQSGELHAAGYLLRARLALDLEIARAPAATDSPFAGLDVFEDATVPDYFACVAGDDVPCQKQQLQRIGIHLASLSARDAYRLGEALPLAIERIALVLDPNRRARFLRAAGPVVLLACDGSKYMNTHGNCLAFLAQHRDLLASGPPSESPLAREACLLDVGSGALRCFPAGGDLACTSASNLLESFSNVNGAMGLGSCSYLSMASSCVPGVGPTCPSDTCNAPEADSVDALSPVFRTVSEVTLDPEQQAAVESACESGGALGGSGVGGAFGAAQAFPGNFCQQQMYAGLFNAGGRVRRCIDSHLQRQAERLDLVMNPLSALERDQGCTGNPYADGGSSDDDDSVSPWSRWGPNGMLCILRDQCVSSSIIQEHFDSDAWEQFKEDYTSLYEAATGDTISDEDWAAAEEEAAKARETTTECSADADACTKGIGGSVDGIRIYYNGTRVTKSKEDAQETAGHEAAHAAGARASWQDRTKDTESEAYYRALDHLTLCQAGDSAACDQYESEKAALPQEQQDELDAAEERMEKEKAATAADGTTMPACGPTDEVCTSECSPSALAAQKTFRACNLMESSGPTVSPLDPYVLPVPDQPGAPEGVFDMGACISATAQAHREQAEACAEYSCPEGQDPEPCPNGFGCCCGGAMAGAMLPPTESCAEVVLCQEPGASSYDGGAPAGAGMCGCESSGLDNPALPGRDPGRVFVEELAAGGWEHPENIQ